VIYSSQPCSFRPEIRSRRLSSVRLIATIAPPNNGARANQARVYARHVSILLRNGECDLHDGLACPKGASFPPNSSSGTPVRRKTLLDQLAALCFSKKLTGRMTAREALPQDVNLTLPMIRWIAHLEPVVQFELISRRANLVGR